MKNQRFNKRSIISTVVSVVCSAVMAFTVCATTSGNISLDVATDKDVYAAGEWVTVSFKADNESESPVTNVSITSELPNGFNLVDGSASVYQDTLNVGEKINGDFTIVLSGSGNSRPSATPTPPTQPTNPTTSNPSNVPNQNIQNSSYENSTDNNSDSKSEDISSGAGINENETIIGDGNIYLFGIKINITKAIIAFVISLILFIGLFNIKKKNIKKLFSLFIVFTLVMPFFKDFSTLSVLAENGKITASSSFTYGGKQYTISAVMQYGYTNVDSTDEKHTVTFDLNYVGTSNVPTSQSVMNGTTVNKPADPTRDNYVFGGWFTDKNCTIPFDFNNTPISNDITLFAKWTKNTESSYEDFTIDDIKMTEDGTRYVDGQIIVSAKDNTKYSDIQLIADSYDCNIVGYLPVSNDYQIDVSDSHDINTILDIFNQSELVEYSYLNYVYDFSCNIDNIITDPWNNAEWDENAPSSFNWGFEAIKAYSAWNEYYDKTSLIKIGLIDSMIDYGHEELSQGFTRGQIFQSLSFNEVRSKAKNALNVLDYEAYGNAIHGTHVAGTMAAAANGRGITGVDPKNSLYAWAMFSTYKDVSGEIKDSDFNWKVALSDLITNKVKVINVSMGHKQTVISDWNKWNCETTLMDDFIIDYLERNYDFLIVNSAGNGADNYNGKFVDTNMNMWWSNSSNPLVRNHVIVVGAVDLDEYGYKLAPFSQTGENVDVVAPGVSIYSSIPEYNTISEYNYRVLDGTSMAAPHVSGAAAFIWSLNPSLSAEQVKDIIVETATTPVEYPSNYAGKKPNMINLYSAASRTLGETRISFYITDEETGEPLSGVNVSFEPNSSDIASIYSDTNGNVDFNFSQLNLPAGNYTFIFNKDGYETKILDNVEVKQGLWAIYNEISLSKATSTFGVTGMVIDSETALPVNDVVVTLFDEYGNIVTTGTTGENGNYNIGCDEGTYNITFYKEGYISYKTNITVNDGIVSMETVSLTPNLFADGDGSVENPYQVATAEQLDAVRNNLDANYIQVADIDLSSYPNWEPIGEGDESGTSGAVLSPFNGSYNGNNYSISNLTISNSSHKYVGLFGYAPDATLSNIQLKNVSINVDLISKDYTVGWGNPTYDLYLGSVSGSTNEQIVNCSATGEINVNNAHDSVVGGIVGFGYVTRCQSYTDITVIANKDGRYSNDSRVFAGGIVGSACAVSADLSYCLNYGNVKATSGNFIYCGGISGEHGSARYCINYGNINGTITHSASTSSFANNCNVGGIIGATSAPSKLDNCVNIGDIFGYSATSGSIFAGGISGCTFWSYGSASLSNCYNACQNISAIGHKKVDDIYEEYYCSAARICPFLSSSVTNDCYSSDNSLVNNEYPTEEIGANNSNGETANDEFINSKISEISATINSEIIRVCSHKTIAFFK